jgi:hypothetical protein
VGNSARGIIKTYEIRALVIVARGEMLGDFILAEQPAGSSTTNARLFELDLTCVSTSLMAASV